MSDYDKFVTLLHEYKNIMFHQKVHLKLIIRIELIKYDFTKNMLSTKLKLNSMKKL
jgi:hypothetical protein